MALPKLIPRDVLFGNPERIGPAISPDGRRLAYIAPRDGVLNVWVGTIGGDDFKPVTDDRDRGIHHYAWAEDNRHLLYIQDQGGDENWRIYDVDLETQAQRDLTPFEGVQAQIVAHRKQFPNDVLVGLNKDNPQLHDVYHLDLTTGALEKIVENPGVLDWVVDNDLAVRAGLAPTPDGGMVLIHRAGADAEFEPLIVFGPEDALTSAPLAFAEGNRAIYLRSSVGVNAGRLVLHDLDTGEEQVIVEDPQFDVTGVALHPDTREPQLAYILKERLHLEVLDPAVQRDVDGIRGLHSGDFFVQGRDHADDMWIVAFTADDGPISYFAWDRANQKGTLLFTHRPELEEYTLASVEPFSFKARDGLELHGYLTFPPGLERARLPTVLNVHGGPWSRDMWGFDPESQWLANRGYLGVQVNYRGSAGYGKNFLNAGDKEWGGKMHDDLIDAVSWVVDRGYADPAKVAIYGGSYGGFAALTGATETPDAFACAVAVCGPSSLKTFIEGVPPYWVPMIAMLHQRVGHPETEEDFLWSRSPLSKVEKIRIPMLVAQGANDPRVKQAESEQIVAAMKEKGIDHEYLLFDDEGHGFAKPENNLKFFGAAERFLARHLDGRSED